jgi:hypothetical protein
MLRGSLAPDGAVFKTALPSGCCSTRQGGGVRDYNEMSARIDWR